jgi:hypothetical protein
MAGDRMDTFKATDRMGRRRSHPSGCMPKISVVFYRLHYRSDIYDGGDDYNQ